MAVQVREMAGDGAAVAVSAAAGDPRPVLIAAGAVPGDRLDVEIEHETRAARFGRILRVVEPSKDRVPTRCPAVGSCGGCTWQAIAYPRQLELKRETLLRAVRAFTSLRD